MVKELCYRGFRISRGIENKSRIDYHIDERGLENIVIAIVGFTSRIIAEDGLVKSVYFSSEQGSIFLDKETSEIFDDLEGAYIDKDKAEIYGSLKNIIDDTTGKMSKEIKETNFQQAQKIYEEVRKMFDIDNELKNYVPKFSSPYEMTLYNCIGIDDSSELKKLIEVKNEKTF